MMFPRVQRLPRSRQLTEREKAYDEQVDEHRRRAIAKEMRPHSLSDSYIASRQWSSISQKRGLAHRCADAVRGCPIVFAGTRSRVRALPENAVQRGEASTNYAVQKKLGERGSWRKNVVLSLCERGIILRSKMTT
jgi:hypothetical protein